MKPRMMPPMQLPIQRSATGKPAAAELLGVRSPADRSLGASAEGLGHMGLPFADDGASPSIIGFGLPFAEDGALAPSFLFPPLPFADDGAE